MRLSRASNAPVRQPLAMELDRPLMTLIVVPSLLDVACASVRECHPTSKRFCDPDRADGSKRDAVDAKARSHRLD
jgi:hypothetical protein